VKKKERKKNSRLPTQKQSPVRWEWVELATPRIEASERLRGNDANIRTPLFVFFFTRETPKLGRLESPTVAGLRHIDRCHGDGNGHTKAQ
jgi:hypothetical protein